MRKIKKVSSLEVKRAFVVAQLARKKKFKTVKKKVLLMSEARLDKLIEYKKRLRAYNNSIWYLGEVVPSEVGVWESAGGLPLDWTEGSLKNTAQKVKNALSRNPKLLKKRSKRTIPEMLNTDLKILQKEKYLLPIIFKGGTGTNGRKRLKRKMAGDIDDGCMRSIALTISGAKKIKAYIGFPK